jgi:predicted enzyme related to lactoylglutathione lyase
MPGILRARSVLAVQDLGRATRFYVDVLGLSEDAIRSPGWSFLSRDHFHLMLGECRDEIPAGATGNHSWYVHLLVDDVDTYHAEVQSRGADIISPPTDRAYGLREFIILTPDGHRLVIGQSLVQAG